jgi:hypothetical protein
MHSCLPGCGPQLEECRAPGNGLGFLLCYVSVMKEPGLVLSACLTYLAIATALGGCWLFNLFRDRLKCMLHLAT